MSFGDGELSAEELDYVVAGINRGQAEEMLNKLDKGELQGLKSGVQKMHSGEMDLSQLNQIQAGTPLSYEEAKQDFERTQGHSR